MKPLTISQVSEAYDVTPRMLRHYEKIGLITATHKDGYAYRLYDEEALGRLRQIILLRKLHISLKDIECILRDDDQRKVLQIMCDKISELDDDINALSRIRNILREFAGRLDVSVRSNTRFDMLSDKAAEEAISTLTLSKSVLKEKYSMNELDRANAQLSKTENVRILLLPSFTVASYHYIGENPEEKVGDVVSEFVQKSRVYEIKPDARMFGMNNPSPGKLENGLYGYEDWVTIPDDMEVPAPLKKKKFDGGLYAVLTIRFPEFHRWGELHDWVNNSPKYEPDYRDFGDAGCLEEHINWVYAAHLGWPDDGIDGQIDLMLPVKPKG
ncbi:MAG: effector binding domain-containing protein [Eubacterium sp.]|nr:effector binding domain-containing protein [Eubacterium sp.]